MTRPTDDEPRPLAALDLADYERRFLATLDQST